MDVQAARRARPVTMPYADSDQIDRNDHDAVFCAKFNVFRVNVSVFHANDIGRSWR